MIDDLPLNQVLRASAARLRRTKGGNSDALLMERAAAQIDLGTLRREEIWVAMNAIHQAISTRAPLSALPSEDALSGPHGRSVGAYTHAFVKAMALFPRASEPRDAQALISS